MPQAALPRYVTDKLTGASCPPGHRFNLYFSYWREDFSADKNGKTAALSACTPISDDAQALHKALVARQKSLAAALGDEVLVMEAKSLSPFATGLGLEHPVENGFAFLSPYGLPYLAGSGVKGVLRAATRELATESGHGIGPDDVIALFGSEPEADPLIRGALSFWDVYPDCGKAMRVDIMTPHQTGYYQNGDTPHDAGQPTPIPFLAVPVGASFQFVVECHPARLDADLAARWQEVVRTIFSHACEWRGFGAKTAVGYGALAYDAAADACRQAEAADEAEKARRLASLSAHALAVDKLQQRLAANTVPHTPGGKLYNELQPLLSQAQAEGSGWTAAEKTALADALKAFLGKLDRTFPDKKAKELKRLMQSLREGA